MTSIYRLTAAGLLTFVLALCVWAQSRVPPHTDTQEWNDVQLNVPLSKQIDFQLVGTLRIGREVSHPVDERIGSGFSFKLGKYLTVLPNYLHIKVQPFKGSSVNENRLSLPVTVRFPVGQFTLSDRNLFERRMRHPGGDSTRYRNRVQLEHPVKIGKGKLNVFVANEVFYDWSFNAWVRNRFTLGASRAFTKHYTQDFYYLRQNDGHTRPGDLNVVGTTFRFRL